MKLLVCGGRGYANRERVFAILDRVQAKHGPIVIIHGDCETGADRLADEWAKARGMFCVPYPAHWQLLGHRAGPERNQRMLEDAEPDAVVAFPGGRGTADMVRRAKAASIPVWEPGG